MATLLHAGLTNAVLAAVLAVVVFGITRIWRNPQAAHVLWLLVLLKMVTPPLVSVPIPLGAGWSEGAPASAAANGSSAPTLDSTAAEKQPSGAADELAERASLVGQQRAEGRWKREGLAEAMAHTAAVAASSPSWPFWVGVVWISGSVLWGLIAGTRIARFCRKLKETEKAGVALRGVAESVARDLGLRRCPEMRITEGPLSPMLWPLGRVPTVVVPRGLLAALSDVQLTTLLAHEFAHVRRRDHWVRWLEVLCIVAYWWHPGLWLARRELRTAEEACCDALVLATFPGTSRAFGEALLQTADFASRLRPGVPVIVSGVRGTGQMRRRIEMVLKNQLPFGLSRVAKGGLFMFALVVLPLSPHAYQGDHRTAAGQPSGPEKRAEVASEEAAAVTEPPAPSRDGQTAKERENQDVRPAVAAFRLTYADLAETARLVRILFEGRVTQVAEDEQNSCLVVLGPEKEHDKVRMLLSRLDIRPATEAPGAAHPTRANDRTSPGVLQALRDHIDFLDNHLKKVSSLFAAGARGGEAEKLHLARYELFTAKGELAVAEGRIEDAVTLFEKAQSHAQTAVRAAEAAYEAASLEQNWLLEAAHNLFEAKIKLVAVKRTLAEGDAKGSGNDSGRIREKTAGKNDRTRDTGTADATPKIRFDFRFKRWGHVLRWLAKTSGLSLVCDAPPPGTFNFSDDRVYSPDEAIKLLNVVLFNNGHTLVRHDRMLFVVKTDIRSASDVMQLQRVTKESLDTRGDSELVSVVFSLGSRNPEKVRTAITPLLTVVGSAVVSPETRQMLVIERVGVMRTISKIIELIPESESEL